MIVPKKPWLMWTSSRHDLPCREDVAMPRGDKQVAPQRGDSKCMALHVPLSETIEELMRMHPPLAIADRVAYDNTMRIIDALTGVAKPNAGQAEYLNTLSILVDAYENEHQALDLSAAGPLDVLRELMAANDMNASDLGRLLGERSLGAKLLSGSRDLSKSHIRALASHFGVSAELFL
jgi:HTH-type transcriptional regulator/antitoxin HigA